MTALNAMLLDASQPNPPLGVHQCRAEEADAMLRARVEATGGDVFRAATRLAVCLEVIGRPEIIPWVFAAAVDLDGETAP